jgi:hypothetical protein
MLIYRDANPPRKPGARYRLYDHNWHQTDRSLNRAHASLGNGHKPFSAAPNSHGQPGILPKMKTGAEAPDLLCDWQ